MLADRYMDLELAYLPTAAAYALRDLMPVLAPANKRVRVVTMSQLNPAVIKSANVVYVGYLSGLGHARRSRLRRLAAEVGESFDEIIDRDDEAALHQPGRGRAHSRRAQFPRLRLLRDVRRARAAIASS